MREPTKEEAVKLRSLQAARQSARSSLGVVTGLQARGVEVRFLEAVEAEYDFRRTVLGEIGLM